MLEHIAVFCSKRTGAYINKRLSKKQGRVLLSLSKYFQLTDCQDRFRQAQLRLMVGLPNRFCFHTMKLKHIKDKSMKKGCLFRQPLLDVILANQLFNNIEFTNCSDRTTYNFFTLLSSCTGNINAIDPTAGLGSDPYTYGTFIFRDIIAFA